VRSSWDGLGHEQVPRALPPEIEERGARVVVAHRPHARGGPVVADATPARLLAELGRRLPGVTVKVVPHIQQGTTADVAAGFARLISSEKPNLIIWQTGTADVMLGTEPEAFREALDKGVLALQATWLADDDRSPNALWGMNHAGDWQGFRDALKDFVAPQQNMVYADVDGHIGFIAPARVPIRAKGDALGQNAQFVPMIQAERWDGKLPVTLKIQLKRNRRLVTLARRKLTIKGKKTHDKTHSGSLLQTVRLNWPVL